MILKDADKVKELLEEKLSAETERVFLKAVEAVDEAPTIDQWHYPSKGEYPTDGEEVLFRCDGQNYLGTYSDTSHYFDSRDMGCTAGCVDCWQYIVPPKEKA